MRSSLLVAALASSASALHLTFARPPASLARAARPVLCDAPPAADADAPPKIVSFSERALKQLESMRANVDGGEILLRMGVRAGGCSGMSYVMDLMKPEEVDENDTVVELDEGMRCFIDPKSLMFLYGLQLDYSDELIGGGFSFANPNADETCGCGKSFGI